MSPGGLIAALLLITGVLVIVTWPYLQRSDTGTADALAARQRDRLKVYYDRALRNIRDLDEDHALGKLDPAEYAAERELWTQRGVQALKAWDLISQQADQPQADRTAASPLPVTAVDDAAIDHAIEAAIDAAIDAAIEAAVQKERARTQP